MALHSCSLTCFQTEKSRQRPIILKANLLGAFCLALKEHSKHFLALFSRRMRRPGEREKGEKEEKKLSPNNDKF